VGVCTETQNPPPGRREVTSETAEGGASKSIAIFGDPGGEDDDGEIVVKGTNFSSSEVWELEKRGRPE